MSVTLRQRGPRGPLELPSAVDRRPLMDDAAFEEMEELRELCLAPFDADDPHHLAMLETLWRSALRFVGVHNSALPELWKRLAAEWPALFRC